jgi:hypothetical protein
VAERPTATYGGLVFYYRVAAETTGDPTLTVAAVDSADRGIRVTLPVEATDRWQRVQAFPATATILVNGEPVDAAVTMDGETAGITTLRLALEGSEAGLLYVDEVHLTEPAGMLGVGVVGSGHFVHDGAILRAGDFALLGNLELRQELSYTSAGFAPGFADPFTASSVASVSSVAADLPAARIEGEVDLLWSAGTTSIRGGHSVTIPTTVDWFSLSDSYSHGRTATSFARGNELAVRVLGVSGMLATEAVALEELFRQEWSGSLQGTLGSAGSGSVSASAVHAAEGVPERPSGYVDAWLRGYSFLTPWNPAGYVERRAAADGRLGMDTRPLGFSVAPNVAYAVANRGPDRVQEDSGSLELRLPVRLPGPAGGLSLTPGYRREFTHRRRYPGTGAFPTDVRRFGDGLRDSRYLYDTAPYAELVDEQTPRMFAKRSESHSAARYTPGASVEVGRRPGSRMIDLFAPSAMRVGVSRTLQREAHTLRDGLTTDVSLRSTALNLFGAFGAYSLTDIYETEEITHAAQLTAAATEPLHADGSPAGDPTWRIDGVVQQFLDFSGGTDRGLSLDSRMAVRWGDQNEVQGRSTVSFRWGGVPVTLRLPQILERFVDAPTVLSHNDTVRYDGTLWNPGRTVLPAEVLGTHKSTLRFGTQGSISGMIGIGWARLPVSAGETKEPIHHVGIQGELRGQIVF